MNYSEIVAAAKAYADRTDTEVSNNIDTFILLIEAKINRVLKTREQSTTTELVGVANQEYYDLPSDYAGLRHIQINNGGAQDYDIPSVTPTLTNPEKMSDYRTNGSEGRCYYVIQNDQLLIHPLIDPPSTISLFHYQKVPGLTSSNTTNWMSDSHPDIYIAGLVAEIEAFAKNYESSKLWYARMMSAIEELDNVDDMERWSGVPMQIQVG